MILTRYKKERVMNTNIRKELLKLIEKNSKVATSELSKMLGVSEADVLNEMSELEKEHIICGYLTLIDWDKTDVEKVIGLIEVKVTPQRGQGFDKIAESIFDFRCL